MVEIFDDSTCISDRNAFLGNYSNKSCFVDKLKQNLADKSINVIQTRCDADTTIVKTALNSQEIYQSTRLVVVLAEDTDILCMLIHHIKASDNCEILLGNVRTGSARVIKTRLQYRMSHIIGATNEVTKEFILFGHAFTGCDCTSAIYNFGKTVIFEKLAKSQQLRSLARTFYDDKASVQSIGEASIKIFSMNHLLKSDGENMIKWLNLQEKVLNLLL